MALACVGARASPQTTSAAAPRRRRVTARTPVPRRWARVPWRRGPRRRDHLSRDGPRRCGGCRRRSGVGGCRGRGRCVLRGGGCLSGRGARDPRALEGLGHGTARGREGRGVCGGRRRRGGGAIRGRGARLLRRRRGRIRPDGLRQHGEAGRPRDHGGRGAGADLRDGRSGKVHRHLHGVAHPHRGAVGDPVPPGDRGSRIGAAGQRSAREQGQGRQAGEPLVALAAPAQECAAVPAVAHVPGDPTAVLGRGLAERDARDGRVEALAGLSRHQAHLPRRQALATLQHGPLHLAQREAGDGVDPFVRRPCGLEDETDPLRLGEPRETVLDRAVALAPLGERVNGDGILELILVDLGDVGLGARALPAPRPGDGQGLVAQDGVEPGHEPAGLGDGGAGERDLHRALIGVLGVVERSGVSRREADQTRRGGHRATRGGSALVVRRGWRGGFGHAQRRKIYV